MKAAAEVSPNAAERLFPNDKSFYIFWAYISLFVSQGLLIQQVQRSNIYGSYSPVIVLLAELVKLVICISIYLSRSRSGWPALLEDVKLNQKLLALYIIPAFLYCLYNNLTFVNQKAFDVTTYYCLMQFRIVVTAVIYQFLFNRQLTLLQWTSLFILTTGCLIKQYGAFQIHEPDERSAHAPETSQPRWNLTDWSSGDDDNELEISREPVKGSSGLALMRSTGLLVFQIFCACFAGVYNEYLLKDSKSGQNSDVILQNIFMYVDSIVCNLIFFILPTNYNDLPNDRGTLTILKSLLKSRLALILILNSAIAGLVSSLFLKNLNSILKTFASALELFAIAFLAWVLFGDRVDSYTIIALGLVSVASVIYSINPVSVASPDKEPQIESREGFVLVPMSDS